MNYFILKNKEVIPVDMLEWAKWFEHFPNRCIKKDEMNGCRISTVFIGMDNQLFETMIFDDDDSPLDGYQERCDSYEDALVMHQKAIDAVFHYVRKTDRDTDPQMA